ncbi:hypothetical protein [Methylorubrum podarium]|uniref:hypothetical protein n=1 Tax=Methylorubrum podarium TaxID=200476 RepID=UPI001EE38A7B|nr:hypothetical protein [Methylorubrum podarium]
MLACEAIGRHAFDAYGKRHQRAFVGMIGDVSRIEAIARRGDEQGREVLAPEAAGCRIADRHRNDAIKPAIRIEAQDVTSTEARVPEVTLSVEA